MKLLQKLIYLYIYILYIHVYFSLTASLAQQQKLTVKIHASSLI